MRTLLAAAGLALVLAPSASAHATLQETAPEFRERLRAGPAVVALTFTQPVKAVPRTIEVRDARGVLVSGSATPRTATHVLRAPVRPLGRGAYTVRWRALSADGHVISGVFTFGVRVAAPPPTEAFGATGPTTAEHVVRWLYFVALALIIGGLGFRLLVLPRDVPRRLERRFFVLAGIGAVATIEAGVAAFLLRAEGALQLPFGDLLYGDLSSIAEGTRLGAAFVAMTLGFAAVTALLFLSWLTDRRALLWAAFLLALGFASGLSLSGHASTEGNLAQLADWVHLVAACLWVGGLVQLAVAVWPTAPELRRLAFVAFSRIATALIAVLVAAGVYLSIVKLPQLADLWTEAYGQVLLVKLGLVSLALSWGAFHHFRARPVLEREHEGRLLRFLPRSLIGESAVGMAVLLAAAVLVNSSPPPDPGAKTPEAASSRR